MKITVRDVNHLPFRTRLAGLVFDTPGNAYDTTNWPEITDEDIARWHEAGFISVDGVADGRVPDPNRRVILSPDKIRNIVTRSGANG